MARTIEYWRETTQAYHPGPPGISVLTDDDQHMGNHPVTGAPQFMVFPNDFRDLVDNALRYIRATPGGQQILAVLSLNSAVGISPSQQGNSVASGPAAMNLVAQELAAGALGGVTQAALALAHPNALTRAAWLAQVINTSPELLLNALPGSGGGHRTRLERARQYANQWALLVDPRYWRWSGSNEGYFNNQTFGGSLDRNGYNINFTAAEATAWITTGGVPPRLTPRESDHAVVATLAALQGVAPSGGGSPSAIGWNPYPSNPLNLERPPAIGLAHELVHAYYNFRGEQPGRDFGHCTTVLFEFLCIGLGPWDEALLSENGIRRHWQSHAVPMMAPVDVQNRKAMPKRIKYL